MTTMTPLRPVEEATPDAHPRDITAVPRAVLTVGARFLEQIQRALGDDPVPTARGNAWEAVCADRARAAARDELRERLHRR